MPKRVTYAKAKRALTALIELLDSEGLSDKERAEVEKATNTARAICDRIPE